MIIRILGTAKADGTRGSVSARDKSEDTDGDGERNTRDITRWHSWRDSDGEGIGSS